MYRLIVEALLGVTLENGRLRIAPCLPAEWPGFTMRYQYRSTTYEIVVRQDPPGTATGIPEVTITLDGIAQSGGSLPLVDDGQVHQVRVDIRTASRSAA
jgi:cellobiose phosphorylase